MKWSGSSLWKQLSLRVVLAALLAIVLVGVPATVLFTVNAINGELANKDKLMESMMNQVDQTLEIAYREGQRLCNDTELDAILLQHYRGGINRRPFISLKLANFVSFSPARLRSVVIRTAQGDIFTSSGTAEETEVFDTEAFRLYVELGRQKLFANPAYLEHPQGLNSSYISCIMPFYSLNGFVGDMAVNIEMEAFETVFQDLASEADEYVWMGYEETPLYPDGAGGYELLDIESLAGGSLVGYTNYAMQIQDGSVYIQLRHSRFSRWVLVAGFTTRRLMENSRWLVFFYIGGLVLSVGFIVAASLVVSRQRLRPLEELNRTMQQVSLGNLEVNSSVVSDDEIGALSETFNYMLAELRQSLDDLLKRKKEEEKMRFSLLISQINPHFIYNTLNTVTYLARLGRTEDVLTVNTALIKILRDTLRVDGIHIMDTVDHEAEVVAQYVTIQRFRFGEDFALHWDIAEAAREELIPKNILQPLVENALQHGLRSKEEKSADAAIWVRVYRQGERLILQVADNGAGMAPEKLASLIDHVGGNARGEHIGLENIRERVVHLYGEAAGEMDGARFTIESREGEGTTVTLVLDLTPPEENT